MKTPYYLIDKDRLQTQHEKIAWLRRGVGPLKSLWALKCFATWSVLTSWSQYMDGSTSSSLYEVKLGFEKFGGGNTTAYSVGLNARCEIARFLATANKIIFNSIPTPRQAGPFWMPLVRPYPRAAGDPGLCSTSRVRSGRFPARPLQPFGRNMIPAQIAAVSDRITGF